MNKFLFARNLHELGPSGQSSRRADLPACPPSSPLPGASKTPAGNARRAAERRLPVVDLLPAVWRSAVAYADGETRPLS